MGKVTYADGVAIAQIVYFIPALFISLFLLIRWRSFAWFFLSTFSILRVVGGIARLLTISHPNSNGIWTTALICSILGMSPLFMATLTLVGRALRAFFKSSAVSVIVIAVHGPAAIALVLSIIGATNANSAATVTHEGKVRVGVCLYIPVLAALALLEIVCAMKKRRSRTGEGALILALLAALPLLCIRLLYALLAVFSSNDGTFSLSHGSETAALLMAVLEEMVVVLTYLAAGLKLPTNRPQEPDCPVQTTKDEGGLPLHMR